MDFLIFALCALAIALAGPTLVRAVEGVGDATGLGHLWLGTVLLAGATSLPELVSVVSAAGIDQPDIAVGTVLGSNMFNMTIFGVVLVLFPLAVRTDRASALTGGVAIVLGAATLVFIVTGEVALGHVGLGAIVLLGLYVTGSLLLFWEARRGSAAPAPAASTDPAPAPEKTAARRRPRRADVVRLAAATAVVFVASLFLPSAAEGIADTLGVSGGVVGVVGVALATSLPEVVTSAVALWRGSPGLVVGNVFGSNVFNVAVLFPGDLALDEGPLLAAAMSEQAVTAAFGLGLMLLALLALVGRMPWSAAGGEGLLRRGWALRAAGVAILLGYLVGVIVTVGLGIETG